MDAATAVQQAVRLLQVLLGSVAVGALVVACGGGVGSTGTGATSNGTYSNGTVSGFGSVIVNGVRYDTSSVQVVDDDEGSTSSNDSALALGMEVEVEAGVLTRTTDGSLPSAHASRIAYGSALLGPVGNLNAAAGTLTVLGQSVIVTDATVFDASLTGGLAALHDGDVINVHGLYDKVSGVTTASRIEVKAGTVPSFYRLRGLVSELDAVAKSLRIGGQLVSYAAADAGQISAGLANGQVVRAKLKTTAAAGVWQAVRIKSAEHKLREHEAHEAELEGVVTVFTSRAVFEVNGLPVDASGAAVVFSNGTAADLAAGVRVEVEGTISNGVLVATKVEFRKSTTDHQREFEFHGAISALETTLKTFALRGSTIDYSGSGVIFQRGGETNLANGVKVEVKGTRSADGTHIVATRIKFED
ncbi:MAG: hypothetical protein RLY71_974 [Pseudomonadota bacterium]|jgi:hypothetical protein